jgi:hypothetical protein
VDEYRRIALAAGCNEYISTPFEPGTLANLIKTLLDDAPTDLNAPETDSTH